MGRRKFPASWKALLHFDYPYYNEPGDGCRDEIGLETWTRSAGVKFVGAEAPNDAIVADTPKFDSYRCPQFASSTDYISGANTTGIFNLSSSGTYEIECFVRPTASTAGNILTLVGSSGNVLTLGLDTSRRIMLTCTSWGVAVTSTGSLALSTWSHVLLRVSGGIATVYVDSVQYLTASLTAGVVLSVTEARLGGFVGQADEFLFKHTASSSLPVVSAEPYRSILDVRTIGGFGDGSYGDEAIRMTSVQINTYALVQNIVNDRTITIGARSNGKYGDFSAGDEVMLHLSLKRGTSEADLWKYAVRRITSISGSTVTLDRALSLDEDGFVLGSGITDNYYLQVVSIPNYDNFTVESGASAVPLKWSTAHGGGILAFKAKTSCTLKGSLWAHQAGPTRTDSLTMTHRELIDRFMLSSSGNVFAVCAALTSTEDARIGNEFPGDGKGGKHNYATAGSPGSVGRGGTGAKNPFTGASGSAGGNAGRDGLPGAGGMSKTLAGPNVILIARSACIPEQAISTGGRSWSDHMSGDAARREYPGCGYGGWGESYSYADKQSGSGGAGTGFVFIATEVI